MNCFEEKSDREKRQVDLMAEKVGAFIGGQMGFGQLVQDLEALQAELETTDNAWREEFRKNWWNLEQVHAVGLDRDYEDTLSENADLISDSVKKMRLLLRNWPALE